MVGETEEAASLPVLHLLPPGAGFAGHMARHHPCCLFLSDPGWLLLVCLPPGLFSGMGVPISADGEPRVLQQCTVSWGGQDWRDTLWPHSPCVLLFPQTYRLCFPLLLVSVRGEGQGLAEGSLPVKDRKQKKDSFQEATNDLIYPFSGTMKPLRCQPMKRP